MSRLVDNVVVTVDHPTLRVFLCGTYADIKAERAAVSNAIERLGLQRTTMELFGARSERPLDVCLEEVRQSDVLVVIVAHRYGSLVPGSDVSFSEAEYREGRSLGKPCLVYLRSDHARVRVQDVERDEKKSRILASFRETLRTQHTCFEYDAPESLGVQVAADLSRTKERIATGVFLPRAMPSMRIFTIDDLVRRQGEKLSEVWVYAPHPLETLSSDWQNALRRKVCANLLAGVRYVYFVESEAGVARIEGLLDRMVEEVEGGPSTLQHLRSRTTVAVLSNSPSEFLTNYTAHRSRAGGVEVFQSVILPDRNDVHVELPLDQAERIFKSLSERASSMQRIDIRGMGVLR